jgi:hypothetical protein
VTEILEMARPIDLTRRRRDRLAVELAGRLKAARQGFVRVEVDLDGRADGVAADEWRAAARQAGRLLGWTVRTSLSQHCVLLVDNRRPDDLTVAERNLENLRNSAAFDRWSMTQQKLWDNQ